RIRTRSTSCISRTRIDRHETASSRHRHLVHHPDGRAAVRLSASAAGAKRVRSDQGASSERAAAGRAAARHRVRLLPRLDDLLRVDRVAPVEPRRTRDPHARAKDDTVEPMTAGHFIFIPAVMLIGLVIGWILGSRAARDAYAAELRRREERAAARAGRAGTAGQGAGPASETGRAG